MKFREKKTNSNLLNFWKWKKCLCIYLHCIANIQNWIRHFQVVWTKTKMRNEIRNEGIASNPKFTLIACIVKTLRSYYSKPSEWKIPNHSTAVGFLFLPLSDAYEYEILRIDEKRRRWWRRRRRRRRRKNSQNIVKQQ